MIVFPLLLHLLIPPGRVISPDGRQAPNLLNPQIHRASWDLRKLSHSPSAKKLGTKQALGKNNHETHGTFFFFLEKQNISVLPLPIQVLICFLRFLQNGFYYFALSPPLPPPSLHPSIHQTSHVFFSANYMYASTTGHMIFKGREFQRWF